MIKIILSTIVTFLMFISIASASTVPIGNVSIDEDPFDDHTLYFTIHTDIPGSIDANTGFAVEGIVEFVIGNNGAWGAWVNDVPNFYGVTVARTDQGWLTEEGPESRYIKWLTGIDAFDSYDYLFMFTSWYDELGESGYLDYIKIGTTDGFVGSTQTGPASPFAAFTADGLIMVGETNAVPIPGSIYILSSGLVLVGLYKKRRASSSVG